MNFGVRNVTDWVTMALTTPDEEEPDIIKVTCRLDAPDVMDLDDIAKQLNMSRTAVATGLLTAAIHQAHDSLNAYRAEPALLQGEEYALRQHLSEQAYLNGAKVAIEEAD